MSKSYDPRLREAMAEIEDVLNRYDIGGVVALASKSHSEFKIEISPSWSLAHFIRKGKAVHLQLHHTKQPQLDQTFSMIYSFRDLSAFFFSQLEQIINKVEKHAKVIHPGFSVDMIKNDDRPGGE